MTASGARNAAETWFQARPGGKNLKILLINSYAGSLLVAAKAVGATVLASLEDTGYGIGCQRLNYPGETYVDKLPWPEPGPSLRDVIALAHPPCACFSVQGANADPATRGVDSPKFKCTRQAVEYALAHGVAALAVESVLGTLEGARAYHDQVAARYGYHLYRIIQNAITFGVPQWRVRFWAIFVRRGVGKDARLWLRHRPCFRTVGEVLDGVRPGAELVCVRQEFDKWHTRLAAVNVNLTRALAADTYGSAPYLAARALGWERKGSKSELEYKFVKTFGFSKFSSAWPIKLDPGGFAPVLMATSHWWTEGRPLTQPEYCALAGFPPDWKFDRPREVQAYLSRGVAPPVARWILEQVCAHLAGDYKQGATQLATDQVHALAPGETADLRVAKRELKQRRLFNLHVEDE